MAPDTIMQPEISVVIPLFNKEKYIRRALDSVLNQHFHNFECIIIDSSTDTGKKLVDDYSDERIIHIIQEKSTAAQARNSGVRKARSDLIAFLDADDEWEPDHLVTLYRIRKKFPDAGLYSTPYVKIRSDGKPAVMLFAGIPKPPWEGYLTGYLRICSRGDEPVHSSSCGVPRKVLDETGGFPENLKYGEDQYLWGKISLKYPVAYSWCGIAIYHTEAAGRICNEKHAIRVHPFSEYLQREIETGNLSMDKIQECRTYIKRKRYAEIFSRIISGNENPSDDMTVSSSSIKGPGKTSGFLAIIGGLFARFHDSSMHDRLRWCLCKIYGCYIPIINSDVSDQQ